MTRRRRFGIISRSSFATRFAKFNRSFPSEPGVQHRHSIASRRDVQNCLAFRGNQRDSCRDAVITAKGENMGNITEQTETTPASTTAEPKATKKASAGARRAPVAPKKGKSRKKASPESAQERKKGRSRPRRQQGRENPGRDPFSPPDSGSAPLLVLERNCASGYRRAVSVFKVLSWRITFFRPDHEHAHQACPRSASESAASCSVCRFQDGRGERD